MADTRLGYCNITLADRYASCEFGNRGALGLTSMEAQTAARSCANKCMQCSRCRYVSYSVEFRDCSWYAECNLDALHDAVPNAPFRTSVIGPHGASGALSLSREYPSRLVAAPTWRRQRLLAASSALQGLTCLSPAGLPISEPHPRSDLEKLEEALLAGRVLHLPHHLLWLKTINPDNVAEVIGTLLSALAVQSDATRADVSWQFAWTHTQHRPTPKHAASLMQRLLRHTWRRGDIIGESELTGATVACFRASATVQTYDFAGRVAASSKAVQRLQSLLQASARAPVGRMTFGAVQPQRAALPTAVLFQRPPGRADNGRFLLNERGILEALEAAGFAPRSLFPAQLSLVKLAQVLSDTALLVSLHGAALCHCMWQPTGQAAVIEAFLPDHAYGLYPLFARVAGVLHLPLFLSWSHVDRRPISTMAAFKASAWARWPGYTNESVAQQLAACSTRPLPASLHRRNLFDRALQEPACLC